MSDQTNNASRRDFIKTSTAAIAGAGAFAGLTATSRTAHAAGSDTLKVGLIGRGGRGSGAATQALNADDNIKLTAMADAFMDRLEDSYKNLRRNGAIRKKIEVADDHKFDGFDGYKKLMDTDVDVVLLTTPPHFRPLMIEEAVSKGKHIFAEKPVCTDAAGYHRALKASRAARDKGLAVSSGLCYRYQPEKRETIKRVHDGAIGEIREMSCYFYTGTLWHRGNDPSWSKMEYQMRNWMYFDWLSGDHIVEQHVHNLDKCAWAVGDRFPTSALATGGRLVRTDPMFGNIYDHFYTRFEWDTDDELDGLTLHSGCRQMRNCATRIDDTLTGTKGRCNIQNHYITGENAWRYPRRRPGQPRPENMYQVEHNELMASIRAGKPLYNGDYMCHSSLMGVMARESAYTGQKVTWDMMINSKLDLSPPSYDMKLNEFTTRPVAKPGETKFV